MARNHRARTRRVIGLGVVAAIIGLLIAIRIALGLMMSPSDAVGLSEFFVDVTLADGRSLDVRVLASPDTENAGTIAAPIIYVHGTPGDAMAWDRYLHDPVEGHPSFALDRPGFGGSDPGFTVPSFVDQATAVAALLPTDGRRAVLVGHSLGGPIIAEVAAEHPDRVAALVVLAGSFDPGLEQLRWYNHLLATPVAPLLAPRPLRVSNDEVLAARHETQQLADRLALVRAPVIIVHGWEDVLVPYANVAYIQRKLTSSASVEVVTLARAGHLLPWLEEDAVRAAIRRALTLQ